MASFIQRKGRAGRIRGSRPMTVTILSDYGKDRWFFQNADKLFNPEIDKISIPIFNPYVAKVQATSFLIDWIGRRIKKNRPYSYLKYSQGYNNTERFKCINLLNKVLNKEDGFYDVFRKNLSYALPLPSNSNYFSEEEKNRIIDEILWHSPRPLMKEVIPTLLRQLESNWNFYKNVNELGFEDEKTKQPLPKFIPSYRQEERNYIEAANILKDSGVDLLILEMLLDINHSEILLNAALQTGLPVWVGLSCCESKFDNSIVGRNFRAEKEKSLIYDEKKYKEQPKFLPEDDIIQFEDIIKTLTNIGGDVYGIMHTWFQDSSGGLKIIKDHWKGPMMYYPEIHKFDTSTHEAIAMSTEDEFANSCLEFIDDQIQIIGGCCGVSDTHLKKLIEKFQ